VARPELASDPRFASATARRENDTELCALLERLFGERDADDWEKGLTAERLGCVRADGPLPGPFFARDAQSLENGMAPVAPHARFGGVRRWGPLVTCDGGAPAYAAGVLAGEQTDALLAELGRSPDEIARLRAAGVVGSEDP
jgi:formyl-CoA transferase